MATIQERKTNKGETKYRVMVRRKGFPTEYATFDRLTDARAWAKQIEVDMKNGRYFKYGEAKRHTVAEMIDRYIREVSSQKSARFQSERKSQLQFWKDQLGDLTLAELTPAKIVEARETLKQTPVGKEVKKPRSPASVNRHQAALSAVLNIAAREWMWLEDSPTRKVSRLQEPRGRVRFLSDDERKALLDACQESSESLLYPIVVVALSTGARRGELLNLRWKDVDFERGFIRLEETKNRERRAVPLTSHAMEIIRELAAVRRIDDDRVFPFRSGVEGLRVPWERALKTAKVTNFRFHDLRHTAASYLAMNGATLAEIAEVLGHKTLQMVKRYAHLTEQHTSRVVERMNKKIFGE